MYALAYISPSGSRKYGGDGRLPPPPRKLRTGYSRHVLEWLLPRAPSAGFDRPVFQSLHVFFMTGETHVQLHHALYLFIFYLKVTKALREMLEKRKSSWAKKVSITPYYQPDFKRGEAGR